MQRCEANEGGQRGYHLIKGRNPNSAIEGASREHTMTDTLFSTCSVLNGVSPQSATTLHTCMCVCK